MKELDYEYLKENNLIIFEAIVGSTAYGTNLPTSDQDKKYVYVLPLEMILRNEYVEQVNDTSNDHVGYEVGRFLDLVKSNNPNIMELLSSPDDCVLHNTPVWQMIVSNREKLLSKICGNSFGQYATTQIQKATGLNKKINNPMNEERKTPLDFCYVVSNEGKSKSLTKWLAEKGYDQKFIGAKNVPNASGVYAIYYDLRAAFIFNDEISEEERESRKAARRALDLPMGYGYKGLINPENLDSNDLRLSSIPKDEKAVALIHYNKNGYTIYCKQYREYWQWVNKRNEERYRVNTEHGKNYDSKNMAHCIRLLEMAYEIATEKRIIVRRPNREELLRIRLGELEYEEILEKANLLIEKIKEAFEQCDLPETPNEEFIKELLYDVRTTFYGLKEKTSV